MTIVQAIETSGPGGAEQVVIRLSRMLREAGHTVRPLLLRRGWLSERLEASGFAVDLIPLASTYDRRFARELARHLRSIGADVLHSHEITFALYGRLATSAAGIAHVATAHGRNFSRAAKRRAIGALTLRGGARFRLVAVSDSLAERIALDFLLGRERVEVVPNGIDFAAGPQPRRRANGEPLALVAVGNLYPVKNHALLVRAVAGARRAGIAAELDILGRGDEEPALTRLAAELGVAAHVRLRGFREDVDEFLARAHLFVSSSVSEQMPISFLEAMGRALPVVASRVGGVPEIVEDGRHGLLFPPGDEAAATAAIVRMAHDEPFRRACGERAAEHARARFGADRMVRHYLRIYGELAA